MSEKVSEPVVIDVRPIPKPQRHTLIFQSLETLTTGQSVVVLNDHNPIPLRRQVESLYGDQFAWQYLEEGPEVYRLQFTRRAAAPEGWKRPEPEPGNMPGLPIPSAAPAPSAPAPVWVDLIEACRSTAHSGPQWAHECEDLDMTLLSWKDGRRIDEHINNEVDVVMLGIEGDGVVTVNGDAQEMRPGVALLIPKGCRRAIKGTSERFSYLSVHRRRRGIVLNLNGRPLPG
jgi:uncharacterized protein (DUF2249 family)/quercetin dioxygenase-like cupin family protein